MEGGGEEGEGRVMACRRVQHLEETISNVLCQAKGTLKKV